MPANSDPQLATRLSPEVMEWVDEMTKILGLTRAEFVRSLLENLAETPPDDPARLYWAAQGVLHDRLAGARP